MKIKYFVRKIGWSSSSRYLKFVISPSDRTNFVILNGLEYLLVYYIFGYHIKFKNDFCLIWDKFGPTQRVGRSPIFFIPENEKFVKHWWRHSWRRYEKNINLNQLAFINDRRICHYQQLKILKWSIDNTYVYIIDKFTEIYDE